MYSVGIRIESKINIKILPISTKETVAPGEKPLQAKLKADYFGLSLFLYLQCLLRPYF